MRRQGLWVTAGMSPVRARDRRAGILEHFGLGEGVVVQVEKNGVTTKRPAAPSSEGIKEFALEYALLGKVS